MTQPPGQTIHQENGETPPTPDTPKVNEYLTDENIHDALIQAAVTQNKKEKKACETFLLFKSQQPLEKKAAWADIFGLEVLKIDCDNKHDTASIWPKTPEEHAALRASMDQIDEEASRHWLSGSSQLKMILPDIPRHIMDALVLGPRPASLAPPGARLPPRRSSMGQSRPEPVYHQPRRGSDVVQKKSILKMKTRPQSEARGFCKTPPTRLQKMGSPLCLEVPWSPSSLSHLSLNSPSIFGSSPASTSSRSISTTPELYPPMLVPPLGSSRSPITLEDGPVAQLAELSHVFPGLTQTIFGPPSDQTQQFSLSQFYSCFGSTSTPIQSSGSSGNQEIWVHRNEDDTESFNNNMGESEL